MKKSCIGKKPPLYRFILNPYQNVRFTRCPKCHNKTKQQKLPLFIHIDPLQPVVLKKTCRYCPYCDLLIAHQDDIEAQLTMMFEKHNPKLIGNEYLVLGTIDPSDWKSGFTIQEIQDRLHDFKEVLQIESRYE